MGYFWFSISVCLIEEKTGFFLLHLICPEPVDIAVCPYFYIRISITELCFGFFSGFKTPHVHILASPDVNPLNIVLLFHWVGNRADFNEDSRCRFLNYRDMFLLTQINSLFLLQDHGLPAADQDSSGIMDYLGYISAHFTFVYFKHFRHTQPSFLR
jgi:hypothetical protein